MKNKTINKEENAEIALSALRNIVKQAVPLNELAMCLNESGRRLFSEMCPGREEEYLSTMAEFNATAELLRLKIGSIAKAISTACERINKEADNSGTLKRIQDLQKTISSPSGEGQPKPEKKSIERVRK